MRAVLDPLHRGVLLSGVANPVTRAALAHSARARRVRRRGPDLLLTFEEAGTLALADPVGLQWDTVALRAVNNRNHISTNAPSVLAEVRRIRAGGPSLARDLLPTSALVGQLDDHQLTNVAVMTVEGGWGACIFDEQGTGKTVTLMAAFDVLVERNLADVLLVVAPKSMLAEWHSEFHRFTGDLYSVAVLEGSHAQKAAQLSVGADVVVTNFEGVATMAHDLELLARRCRVVLTADESYNVKNPDAGRSASLAALREWCVRSYVLCGTPAPNSARDIIGQFDLVDLGHTFGGLRLDRDRITASAQIRSAMDERGVFVRSLKRQVLPHLPGRQHTTVPLDLGTQQRVIYQDALDGLVRDLVATSDVEFTRSVTSFMDRRSTLLRICSNPTAVVDGYDELPTKLVALDALLESLVGASNEKVIVWSFYRASLDAIAARYARYGLVRLDGSIADVRLRRDAVRRFQHDPGCRVFVGNPAAAGAGLTLHSARIAIYESLSNQAAHFLQSLDRIHRRGQDRTVEYIALLCRGTLEEVEYQRLLDKADAQADLLGDAADPRPTRTALLAELVTAQERLRTDGDGRAN